MNFSLDGAAKRLDLENGEGWSATMSATLACICTRGAVRQQRTLPDAAKGSVEVAAAGAPAAQRAWTVQTRALSCAANLECDASVHLHDEAHMIMKRGRRDCLARGLTRVREDQFWHDAMWGIDYTAGERTGDGRADPPKASRTRRMSRR